MLTLKPHSLRVISRELPSFAFLILIRITTGRGGSFRNIGHQHRAAD